MLSAVLLADSFTQVNKNCCEALALAMRAGTDRPMDPESRNLSIGPNWTCAWWCVCSVFAQLRWSGQRPCCPW